MKKSTITKAILFALVTGCVVAAPGSVFAIGAIVKLLAEAQARGVVPAELPEESNPRNVRQSIYRLRKKKYIRIKQVGKSRFKFELTKEGTKLLEKYNFDDFSIQPKCPWDGQWRMFAFDIPEKKRTTRDMLRRKLKKIGFFQFQRSVWIFPFECTEEMDYVCEFLGVQSHALMFAGKIHDDRLLRKYFIREGILDKKELFHSA